MRKARVNRAELRSEISVLLRKMAFSQTAVKLSEALKEGSLERLIKSIARADLLIIDEWGYVPVDR